MCAHGPGSVDRIDDSLQGELLTVRGCQLREVRRLLSQRRGDRTVTTSLATVAGGTVAQIERLAGLLPRVDRSDAEEQQEQGMP